MLFVKNLTKFKIDEKFLQKIAGKTLDNLSKYKKSEMELVIIGKKRMRSLSRIWRGKDKATDVLSFGSQKPLRLSSGQAKIKNQKFKFFIPPGGVINLGQIFICYPVMAEQAKRCGYPIQEEMARLLIHGILHLAGYDHEKNQKEEKKMAKLQEKILKKI